METQKSSQPVSADSHRLPTISASQALEALKSGGPTSISTGLKQLDRLLQPATVGGDVSSNDLPGGILRGQVTEIYGPPGVGKTTLALQICVNAIQQGNHAVWVDAAYPLVRQRFDEILQAAQPAESTTSRSTSPENTASNEPSQRLHSFAAPTLAHLLALFIHPPPSFPPSDTSIIVIDSLSTLFDNAYRPGESRNQAAKTDAGRWATGRRFAVMNELISKLGRMAAVRNIAILFTCQTVTRVRIGSGALLAPALAGAVWDAGLHTRLVLFRDWILTRNGVLQDNYKKLGNVRLIGVSKSGAVARAQEGEARPFVPFIVGISGIQEASFTAGDLPMQQFAPPGRSHKRTFSEVDGNTDPDSEDSYDWAEVDAIAAEGLLVDETELESDLPRGEGGMASTSHGPLGHNTGAEGSPPTL